MATKKATKKVKKSTKAAASTGSSTVVGIKLSGIDKIVSSIDNYKKAVSGNDAAFFCAYRTNVSDICFIYTCA